MANIPDFVAVNARAGQSIEVKAKKFVWVKVGQGAISVLTDDEVGIDGKISILGYNGELHINLLLNDHNPTAASGSGQLRLNSHFDDQARFEVKGRMLTVYATLGGKEQNISILRCNDDQQTECKLFGHINQTVHLDPAD